MSDTVLPVRGTPVHGLATLREIGPFGMISLRAKPDAVGLSRAITACTGTDIPGKRQILHNGSSAAGWMSPDEYLLILPYGQTGAALSAITSLLSGTHHLAVVVSDARVTFRIEGPKADQIMAKLAPVDLTHLAAGELRRTRVAQVAAAFWREDHGFTLMCFRSVAQYVHDLLAISASPGSELS